MSSTKKVPTNAVTAGIRKIDPTMMTRLTAMEMIQARIESGVCALVPSRLSTQFVP